MPIARKPHKAQTVAPAEDAADAFILGAQATTEDVTVSAKAKKTRFMVQFDEAILEAVDAKAQKRGLSRSAWLEFIASLAIERGDG